MTTDTRSTEVPADLRRAVDEAADAVLAIGWGDPEPYMAMWSQAHDVTLFGAWGPCRHGWPELSRTFRWVGSRFGGGDLRSEEVTLQVSGDMAYTVGYERGQMVVDDGGNAPMTIRVTQIFRRGPDGWRLVHRHADFAPIDESAPRRD